MFVYSTAPIIVIHYQPRPAATNHNASSLLLLKESCPRLQALTQRHKVKAALRSEHPCVLVIDYGTEEDGLDAVELAGFHELAPTLRPFAVIDAALADSPRLLDLLRRRLIHDFTPLPLDPNHFLNAVERIGRVAALELSAMRQAPANQPESRSGESPSRSRWIPIGRDPCFIEALASLRRAAATRFPILVTGESGTGKELAARLVHANSSYCAGPLFAVNCAGLAPSLIASELFGHEKGAFTDAKEQKIGKIEAAKGGTLFLDEIGDLPLAVQGFLLRFLEENSIERVGSTKRLVIDTRIVAATNVDLEAGIAAGCFRKDLYYRLNGLSVHLPPLRERGGDSVLLAMHFLERLKTEFQRPHMRFRRDALDAIARYHWPGNIRELMAALRRAVLMADSNLIGAEALRLAPPPAESLTGTLQESISRAERAAIENALSKNRGNVNRASRELGISRVTLYRLLEKHAITLSNSRNLAPSDVAPACLGEIPLRTPM